MLERSARPSLIDSLGELQGLARPTVTAIARPGWETGAPLICPFHPLVGFLGAPVPFFNTHNIENDNSNRVRPFSKDIVVLLEFVEGLISIQPQDDLMRTLSLSRLQDTTNRLLFCDLGRCTKAGARACHSHFFV